MSDRLTEALSAAGWSPGRRVDVTDWVSEIHADGPEVPATAEQFWASFGGLTIRRPRRYETVLELDPTEVTGYGDRPSRWLRQTGQTFSPIGVYNYSDGLWIGDRHPADLFTLKPEDLRTVSELLAGSSDREGRRT